jgi:hypothetical protein
MTVCPMLKSHDAEDFQLVAHSMHCSLLLTANGKDKLLSWQ